MQIVHYGSKTKGLFVLSFIFFCFSWVQSHISTLELGCRLRNSTFRAFTLDVLSLISSSASLTASPSSSAVSLHSWLIRRGWFLCHFRSCLFLFLFLFFFQPQRRQQGSAARVRAAVAPFSSSSSSSSGSRGPPPLKASRPALTLLGCGGGRRQAPVMQESDDEDNISTAIQ